MTDTSITPNNQQIARSEGKTGLGKITAAILSAVIISYLMNQASLHGVNFEFEANGIKVSSELVKSTLEGTLTGVFVGLTPNHLLASLLDVIAWVKNAQKQIRGAWNSN